MNSSTPLTDPLPLAQALLRCASVTPADAGAQTVLAAALERLGFSVTRLRFGHIENLFARLGTGTPHICFAGHTDVVPAGTSAWQADPFGGEVRDGILYGRGACDMKGAVAAFVAACAQHLAQRPPAGSISLLITGDEEGPAVDGTVRVLEWMAANGQIPDFCLVGEPTNPTRLGEMIKIGRRGSLTARITVHGIQGHVAYPQRCDNPVHRLVRALDAMTAAPLDAGSRWFEPSTLQVTTIDVGNRASNVVPATAHAVLNIRFNDRHDSAALEAWLRATRRPPCRTIRDDGQRQRRELPHHTRPGSGDPAQRHRRHHRHGTETGHRRRHLGRALHRPVLPGGRVRAGRCHDPPDGRARAGGRTATARHRLPVRAGGVRRVSTQAAIGVARLARFRADGLQAFDASPAGLLNALAPWLAFALVGFVLMLTAVPARQATTDLLATVVGLLTPAVVSHALARLWGRQAAWLRYAVAFIWCQWVMVVAWLASVMGTGLMMAVGLPEYIAEDVGGLAMLVYAVALQSFVIRRALDLSGWRTAAMVVAINVSAVVLVLLPTLLNNVMEVSR